MKRMLALFTMCLFLSMASESIDIKEESRLKIYKLINPCKGETVWVAPEKEVLVTWPTYGNLEQRTQATLTLPSEFEITFSPITSLRDAQRLMDWLTVYDSKFAKPMEPTYLTALPALNGTRTLYGTLMGRSLLVNSDEILKLIAKKQDLEFNQDLLAQIITEAHKMGANQVHLITEVLPTNHKNIGTQALLNLTMARTFGFKNHPFGFDLEAGMQEKRHTLNITQTSHLKRAKKPLIHLTTESVQFTGHDITYLSTSFNFMVRDESGACLGGICGTLERDAKVPYAHMSPFVMSDEVRHNGFGRQVMALFETYVKSSGLGLIELDTCDFQVPKFYEKNGYMRAKVMPNILVGHQGQSYGMQTFLKKL